MIKKILTSAGLAALVSASNGCFNLDKCNADNEKDYLPGVVEAEKGCLVQKEQKDCQDPEYVLWIKVEGNLYKAEIERGPYRTLKMIASNIKEGTKLMVDGRPLKYRFKKDLIGTLYTNEFFIEEEEKKEMKKEEYLLQP